MFYVNIITEAAVRSLPAEEAKSRKKIVLSSYTWTAALEAVQRIIDPVEGEDWTAISNILRIPFAWEFENYQAG
jgi:hypothetical protein